MFERIDTICLKVRDIKRACEWYKEKLDCSVSFAGEGYRVLTIGKEVGIPLTIEEGERVLSSDHNYPIFFTKDIHIAHRKLIDNDVTTEKLHFDGDNHYFTFYDLDGNKLQVCHY
ncbi:VOC family protein [Bacillus sp. P14.5]|uniref:VOC family protein n=1 Tax=Bacillus sp. P14.5 TaxID=1983400 RepID=UPI000DEAAB8C|nr:VOC family protein [Bacillus sp. P14.5]